jgi:hypothetical protein
MMADDQPRKDGEATPKSAVEVDDKDLDQAAGGAESLSLNFSKVEVKAQPQSPAGWTGPVTLPPDEQKKI